MKRLVLAALGLGLLLAFVWAFCSSRSQKVERAEWPVMGTIAAIQVRGGGADALRRPLEIVKTTFAGTLAEFNRFDPTSHLSVLAPLDDAQILAEVAGMGEDSPYARCYRAAFELMRQSEGAFNPRWKGRATLDFGAIAKGFAVDYATELLAAAALPDRDLLIDLGGNLKAVKGDWTVGVKDGGSFTLREGEACATSARYYRGDHIRDGRTGASISNAVHSVTVIHPTSAMLADGLSTTLFVLGRLRGEAFLEKFYPAGRAVWLEGE